MSEPETCLSYVALSDVTPVLCRSLRLACPLSPCPMSRLSYVGARDLPVLCRPSGFPALGAIAPLGHAGLVGRRRR